MHLACKFSPKINLFNGNLLQRDAFIDYVRELLNPLAYMDEK